MEMQRDCGPLIKQINDELRKNANNVLRAQGMTFAQLEALVQLEQAPDRTRSLKELEQLLHHLPAGTERTCGGLWRRC